MTIVHLPEIRFSKSVDNGNRNVYNEKRTNQQGVMWTLENDTLNKREVAEVYKKISETKNQGYKNYVLSNDGDLIYEIGDNKLVYTDGDYEYPEITKVIEFNVNNPDDIEYAKECILNAERKGNQIEDALEIVNAVYGEENIRATTYKSYETNTRSDAKIAYQQGNRIDSSKTDTDSGEDVRFSKDNAKDLDRIDTQDLLIQIANDIGYHEGLIQASKKNKQEFREVIGKNERLSASLENAKKQMKRTKVPKADPVKVGKRVRSVLKSLQSKADPEDTGIRMAETYNEYLTMIKDAGRVKELEDIALDELAEKVQDIAADILDEVEMWTPGEDYKNLMTYLRLQPIAVSDSIKNDIHYNEFRKANMGTLNLANNGAAVDTVYQELVEMFPHLFDDTIQNPADQIQEIADVVREIKPQKYNPYERFSQDALDFVTEQLISGIDGLVAGPTKADKMIANAEYQHELEIERRNEEFAEKYEKLRKEAEDYRTKAERAIEEQKYIRFWEQRLFAADKKEIRKKAYESREQLDEKWKERKDMLIGNIRERQAIRILKASIRKIANDFKGRLLNPTDTHTLPAELIKSIAEVSSMLDFTTDRKGKDGGENKTNLRLLELRDRYDDLKNDEDYDLKSEWDEDLSDRIKELDKIVKDKRIIDLNKDELSELYSILKEIKHTITTANYQIGKEKAELNKEIGMTVMEEMKAQKGFDRNVFARILTKLSSEMLNPMRVGRMISGYDENTRTFELFKDLNEGLRKYDLLKMKMSKPFEELIRGTGNRLMYNAFRTKLIDTGMKYSDGSKVMLTKDMICELVKLWDRKQGKTHLERDGFTVPDFKAFFRGNIKAAFTSGQKTVSNVTEGDIAKLRSLLDKYDKTWIDKASDLFDGAGKKAINDTSLILKGRKLAQEENYITIHTDKNFVRSEIEGVRHDASIEGSGSLKNVVRNAPQPVYLMGLSHTVNEHIDFASKYAGLAIPIRNFNKVYNVGIRLENGSPESVKEIIGRKWGASIRDGVIEKLLTDLQTGRKRESDMLSGVLVKAQSNWVSATLNANISVCIKQAASFPTAAYVVGSKALTKALNTHEKLTGIMQEIDEHTGAHYKRRLGLSLQELGDRAEANTFVGRLTDKIDSFAVDKMKINSAALPSNWIQSVDVWTTAKLWLAAKYYVADTLKIKKEDDNYWDRVTQTYEKIIDETQPNYDVMHRPEVQKTTNALVRATVIFQTQPLQNTGIFFSALGNLSAKQNAFKQNGTDENKAKLNDAKKEFGRAALALASSMMVFGMMAIVKDIVLHKVKKYRDDKDKKVSPVKIGKYYLSTLGDQIVTTFLPVIGNLSKDVYDNVKYGYEYELPITSLVNDSSKAVSNIGKVINDITGKEAYLSPKEKAEKIAGAVGGLIKQGVEIGGIPVSNFKNIADGAIKYIKDIANGEIFSSDADEYKPKYIYNHTDLAGAIISGNTKKEAKIKKYFEDNDRQIQKSALTSSVKDAYLRYINDNPDEAERIRTNLIGNYGYTEDQINKWTDKDTE